MSKPLATKTIACAFLACISVGGALSPFAARAQQCLPTIAQTLGADPHHTAVAGGSGRDGTQLAAHDTIIVQARATSDPAPPVPAPCRSVTNNSNISYFVPWHTPNEWQHFLNAVAAGTLHGVSIGTCCPPDTTETICGVQIGALNGTGNNNLGARWLGLPAAGVAGTANDVPYYGGANDVVGPIYACNALGSSVDFATTFVCQNGSWIQTHSVGSCEPLDGVCGSIPAGGFVTLPPDLTTLCAPGSILENLSGSGPWTWQCYGTLGTAQCSAPLYSLQNGACGAANGAQLTSAPIDNLCTSGIASTVNFNTNNSDWVWTCAGIDGGTSASCSAINSNPPGICGPANGTTVLSAPAAPTDLCMPGDTSSPVTETAAGLWQWSCYGPGGGAAAFCSALNANPAGACGSDANKTLTSPPVNLCSSGSAGPITDAGGLYWYWYCYQLGDPNGVYCQAYNANAPGCGSANGATLPTAPNGSQLCNAGTAINYIVTPQQWTWSCVTSTGSLSCSAQNLYAPVNGACGGANGVPVLTPPTAGFCSAGIPTAFAGTGPWSWTCAGSNGGTDALCQAPLQASYNGQCGTSDGLAMPNTPNVNLCATGTPSTVSGTGPWSWTCSGAGTGTAASCSAALCNACAGQFTLNQSFPRSVSDGSCHASGGAGWTETYQLQTSNAGLGTLSIQWGDAFGPYSAQIPQNAAPWPQYCSPCYLRHLSASNVGTTITTDNGSCPPGENAGSFVPATGVTVQ